jgi:hypothetical protein
MFVIEAILAIALLPAPYKGTVAQACSTRSSAFGKNPQREPRVFVFFRPDVMSQAKVRLV